MSMSEGGATGRKALAACATFGLMACFPHSAQVHYRLTVAVVTPEGVKTGSGVMSFELEPGFPQPYSPTFRGEAIPIDLGSRGTLFMILAGRTADGHPINGIVSMLPENVFRRVGLTAPIRTEKPGDRIAALDFLSDHVGSKAELQCRYHPIGVECPFFVRFRDIEEPASVAAVDPENLAKSFGPGVRLKRITIEITDDPVTTGIEKRLKWLPTQKGSLAYSGTLHPEHPERDLTALAFKRGK